jgi:perosamine synthetase
MARPDIGARERELVARVLDTDVLALGPYAEAFGQGVADLVGRRHGIACSSGTSGLHMIVRALGIGEGDEVITTPFSFVASSNAILYERATPRFVDIEDETLGLDPARIADAANARTAAVLPVHVFGRPCRIDEVMTIADARGWPVIEDACEALGSASDGRPMGSFGAASVFAFYPNKQVTTGEGGVVVTDDDELAELLLSLRNQGRDRDGTWLRHVRLGFNYRMDELSAAVGVAQLERLAEIRLGRARVAAGYEAAIGDHPRIRLPRAGSRDEVDWFVYVVQLHKDVDRDVVMADLQADGVPSRPYFQPLHLQPFYRELLGHAEGDFPVTERVAATTLALPWSSQLQDDEVTYVAERLMLAVERQGRG